MKEKKVNVAIYGSGIAGLTAAVTLLEHGVRDVCVFEKKTISGWSNFEYTYVLSGSKKR